MKIKWKGKIAIGIMATLILINVSTLITTSDDPSGNKAGISVHIPPIDRGDNGVADIYIHLDPISSEKTHIEKPKKIIIAPLSNDKKIKTLVFQDQDIHMENDKILVFQDQDMHVRNDNRVHLHPLNMPDCEKAEITIYLPNDKITKQAIVRQVPKPEKVIHVNSTKSGKLPDGITLPDNVIQNMGGVAPLWGQKYVSPPFPDGDSDEDGITSAKAHVDLDTGDGGASAGSYPKENWWSWASPEVYNTHPGKCWIGMNWLGIQQIGVTIKNGYMYTPLFGVKNYGEVSIRAYELDENRDYVSNNYHRLWYISYGTDRDIDADIDSGAWIVWNPNHCYRGIADVYVEAAPCFDARRLAMIDLGEDCGDIDFDYISWFWFG